MRRAKRTKFGHNEQERDQNSPDRRTQTESVVREAKPRPRNGHLVGQPGETLSGPKRQDQSRDERMPDCQITSRRMQPHKRDNRRGEHNGHK